VINSPSDHLDRRDANPARMTAFRKAICKAKEEWFDKKFGESQMCLTTLATYPDYMRRGAGKALCEWGIKKAVSDKLAAVTLFSSPMGKPLYTKLGFRQVGMVHTQVEGEEEFPDFPGMILELK
jgi:predicted N-acetyltransferase YhbS